MNLISSLKLAMFLLVNVASVILGMGFSSPLDSEDELSIRTLSGEDYFRPNLRSADALLSDWEGDHWASLDADMDKVALSWTTDAEHITFQVSTQMP